MSTSLGVVGLGSMGMGVARSALRGGVSTWGFDLRSTALDELASFGGSGVTSPSELGRHCDVVVVLVVNGDQTEDVLFGSGSLASNMRPGSVVIGSATVDPALPPKWEQRLGDMGVHFIDGPVSGGAVKAADGQMTMMASGSPAAFEATGEVLSVIAARVHRLGDAAGIGSTVKMVNQHLAGVHIAAACEALALGIRAGADPHRLYEVICDSAGMSWMFQNRVPHILEGDYTPLSAVSIFVKDLGIVLGAAEDLDVPLPLASAAHQVFVSTADQGHRDEDDSAVIKFYAALSGISLPGPPEPPSPGAA